MMDQYKEQYKKETEQIHAPVDLIAKTKAAVRQEESRIRKERAAQTEKAGTAQAVKEGAVQTQVASEIQKKRSLSVEARKWAYPLTAAAAVLVLVSVSMMMRGLGKSYSDSASYESAAAADAGGEESATEESFEEAVPEAASISEGMVEAGAGDAASDADMDSTEEIEDMASDTETASAEAAVTSGPAEAEEETKRMAALDEPGSGAESKKESLADSVAQPEEVWVERTWKKPAFTNRADIESRTYEDKVFQVAEDGDGWIAYVESDDGGGYVIRGKAKTMELFLEAGYQRLLEISF